MGAILLVSACYTDLGDEGERRSGYYPRQGNEDGSDANPWNFSAMRKNCPLFFQFHSDDDPFIPLKGEALRVKEGLGLRAASYGSCLEEEEEAVAGKAAGGGFFMLPGRSHFFDAPFPELLSLVDQLTTGAGMADVRAGDTSTACS